MMADLLGTLMSSLELTAGVIHYLNAVKDGGKARDAIKCQVEAAGKIIVTLTHLRNGVHQDVDCLRQVGVIASPGPGGAKSFLSEYEDLLHEIIQKLGPKDHKNSTLKQVNKIAFRVKWPFLKEDVQAMVEKLYRLQNSFQSVSQSVQIEMLSNVLGRVSPDVLGRKLDQMQLGLLHSQGEKDFKKHCSWLSDMSPSSQLQSLLDESQFSPPTWIFEDQVFEEWRTSTTNRVLWANGSPGAGKSVLAAVVVAHLRGGATSISTSRSVGAFFYRYNDSAAVETMLRCIARQLLEQGGAELLPKVKELRQAPSRGLGRSEATITTLLSELCSHFDENFLVIDALDECDVSMQSTTVSHLKTLLEGIPSLHIMVTSRRHMEMYFLESEYLCQARQVEVSAQDENVQKYVEKRIERIAQRSETALHDTDLDFRESIVKKVVRSTMGIFLLAVRHMEALEECEDQYSLEKAISSPTNNLGKTIEDAIKRIQAQKESRRNLGMRALLWVVNMMRPLRLDEVRHALATYNCKDDLDERRLSKEINIYAATEGLITVEKESGVLSMHKSILDYFSSRPKQIEVFGNDPDTEMSVICIKYLSFSRFDSLCWNFDNNPFLSYALPFWVWHVVESNQKEELIQVLKTIIGGKRQLQYAVQTLYNDVMSSFSSAGMSDDVRDSYATARAILLQILQLDNHDDSFIELPSCGELFTYTPFCSLNRMWNLPEASMEFALILGSFQMFLVLNLRSQTVLTNELEPSSTLAFGFDLGSRS